MSLMRIQARLPRDGGTPADDTVNVWHFDSDQSFADDADDTVERLAVFYQAIQAYLANVLSGALHFKVYDMEETPPRAVKYERTDLAFSPASTALPAEVAICLSFEAAEISGQLQRRRRGRVFLGPLSQAVMATATPDVVVDSAVRTAIATAAAAMAHGPDAGDARLAVYSRTLDITGSTADAFNDVVSGWVDNAFDTQRRRGAKATTRTTWTPA